jgi:hypothetical protein
VILEALETMFSSSNPAYGTDVLYALLITTHHIDLCFKGQNIGGGVVACSE